MILEILYNIWFGGVILGVLNMVSTFVFGSNKWAWKQFFATSWFIAIWPLAIVSPEGRAHLLGKFHKL